jgi:DNA-binding transcriptional ArsR family regulator
LQRIRFSAGDLARTRIAATADPMWELALSMHQLRLAGSDPFLHGWKRQLAQRLHPSGPSRAEVALALALNPPRGYFPDFLTPFDGVNGFEAGLEAMLGTDPGRLRAEVDRVAITDRSVLPDVDGIRLGKVRALKTLGHSVRRYHDLAVAPVWETLTTAVRADREQRLRDLASGGWAGVLGNLHPSARFRDDVFEIDRWGGSHDREIELGGRGLLIIPSYFKEQRQLLLLADTALPPVLLYPINQSARLAVHSGHLHLPALIGRNRTLVLEATVSGGSTSEIAARVNISVPAASKHLHVLRVAGLVRSTRTQNTVDHHITALGHSLLSGTPNSEPVERQPGG